MYEYDRNLLQQDAVQYIAAYKYELGTILAALNMCQFVRPRPRLTDKPPRRSDYGTVSGAVSGGASSGGGAPLPKPGSGRGRGLLGRSPQHRGLPAGGGFNMSAVLTAVGGKDAEKGELLCCRASVLGFGCS